MTQRMSLPDAISASETKVRRSMWGVTRPIADSPRSSSISFARATADARMRERMFSALLGWP